MQLDHRPHRGHGAVDELVGQEHRERLVADQRTRAQHGVAESQRLRLAHVAERQVPRNQRLQLRERRALAGARKLRLELVGLVEMVLDRALGAARDEDHVGDARGRGFLDGVLDERLVDDRQQLLGTGFRRRKKAGAEPRDGKHGLAHR